jgi:hypothetical protein
MIDSSATTRAEENAQNLNIPGSGFILKSTLKGQVPPKGRRTA